METIFLLNIIVNFLYITLLSILLEYTFNKSVRHNKVLILYFVVSFLISVLNYVFSFNNYLFFTFIISALMVVIFKPLKIKNFLLLELVLVTYILIGWAVGYFFQVIFFSVIKMSQFSFYCFLILRFFLVVFVGVMFCVFFCLYNRNKLTNKLTFKIVLKIDEMYVKFSMFLDSGNMLYDNTNTGLPILIISKEAFEEKTKKTIRDFRSVEIETVNGRELVLLPVIQPDAVFIKCNKSLVLFDAVIGLVNKNFNVFDGLLHSKCFELVGGVL